MAGHIILVICSPPLWLWKWNMFSRPTREFGKFPTRSPLPNLKHRCSIKRGSRRQQTSPSNEHFSAATWRVMV